MNKRTKINRSDLKAYPSERLTDNDDGGGMPTGTPLTGAKNELFKPVSSIARVNGDFNARLVYAGVRRADDTPLIGAFMAITEPPKDTTISYLLFRATKDGELRREILKRIEAYSVGTIESRMTLLSTQSKYSRIIQAYQRPGEPLPLVGDVYCLRQDKRGYPQHEQYVQVISVKSEDRTFTNPTTGKDFVRTVVKLEISSKLETDFIGADYPSEYYIDNPCKIRETHVADAAQYYGVKPLAKAIKAQSQQIQITSLMEKLVPTNQIETALIDLTAAGQTQTLFDGSKKGDDGLITLSINVSVRSVGTNLYLGNAVLPASVEIDSNAGKITDDGGTLRFSGEPVGVIDYAHGEALLTIDTYVRTVKFRAAASDLKVADTTKIDIELNNRSYDYVLTLDPIPAVGSLQVSYRAQGNWYTLRDDGNGMLRGMSQAHGSGSISYKTGTINISCGELPDVGSSILFAWGTRATYFNRSNHSATAKMLLQLSKDAEPSTLTLSWNDGSEKTASCDASGKITGDWTGHYDAATNQIHIDTNEKFYHPSGGLNIKATYNTGEKTHKEIKAPLRGRDGTVTIELGEKPIAPNSFNMRFNLNIEDYDHLKLHEGESRVETHFVDPYKVLHDDGNGKLLDETGQEYGTIDYERRTATFKPDTTVRIPKAVYNKIPAGERRTLLTTSLNIVTAEQVTQLYRNLFSHYEYIPAGAAMPIDETALVEVWFYDTDPRSQTTEQLTSGQIEIDLLPNFAETIVTSSVNFSWGNKTYFDKLGSLYTDLNPQNGAAELAGSIDYQSGKALLKVWQWTNGSDPSIKSLATSINANPVDSVTFRTPSSPIRPGSLQVRAVATDGTKIMATAGMDGQFKGKNITGFVDVEYGVADIQFGEYVNAAGNESEDWYNPDAVHDGKIFKPKHVFAETITYNTVAYSYLPVDSTVVKIDTVRLPQDGRIPIFRRGDTILIGNRQTEDIGSAHSSGQTVQLSRKDLDRICVKDADGKPVNAELWDYDLDEGTITWTTPLDLAEYKMPLSVMHAQEERNLILKADIDGTLSLIFPTKRDYPIENTYVSSVLIGGNLEVRVSVPFTQKSWDNTWKDEVQGEQTLNKLNLKDYPMVLTDDGAITERWAIKWTASNQFELYGETLGFVLKTDTLQDLAPINPATKKPYFRIPKEAFGNDAPWQAQNLIRFNTWGTLMPVWVLCAVQPSSKNTEDEDGFTYCLYGDTTEV